MTEDLTKMHSYLPKLVEQMKGGRVDRREFLRTATLLGLSAGAAYGFSFVFGQTGSHAPLFALGAAALALALAVDLATSRGRRSAAVQAQPPLRPGIGGERRLGRDLRP